VSDKFKKKYEKPMYMGETEYEGKR